MGDVAIQVILMQWGRSRHLSDPQHCYYPSETPFNRMRRNPGRGTVATAGLSEALHGAVDQAVSALKQRNPARHEVLWRSYVDRESDSAIARNPVQGERYSRHEVKNIRVAAEAWVEAQLEPVGGVAL